MKKYTKQIISILAIIIFAIYIIVISPRTMQNDTFWSIKVGEKLVNEGIWEIDDFSIHEGLHYIAHHFLTDIIIYVIYNLGGFTGLYILEVVLAMILAAILYLLNKEISGNKFVSAVLLFLQMWIMSMYIAVRAQMISFILFTVELLLLEKFIKINKKRYVVGLSIIPILLANFHMGVVPFFFVILGVYIVSLFRINIPLLDWTNTTDKTRIKQLVIVFSIGLITIFINPYFVDGVIYPFKTFGNDFINSTISEFENLTLSFDGGWTFGYIAIILLTLIFAKEKIKTRDFLLKFGTLLMSLVAIRYISLFVICSAVILRYVSSLDNLFKFKEEEIKSLKWTGIILFVLMTSTLLSGYMLNKEEQYRSEEYYPKMAIEFLKKNINEEDRIFNYYDWGSSLMLNDIKVYIDSRCDLYTKEYNGTDIATDHNKLLECDKDYKNIIKKYNINMFFIPAESSLATLLEENNQYEKIYMDDAAVIYKQI